MSDEPKTISVQVDSDFYNRFMRFCFKNELTKSDAIRHGINLLMEAEAFIRQHKTAQDGKQ